MPKNIFFLLLIPILFTGCFTKKNKTLTLYGNIDVRTVILSFQVPGKISKLYYKEGQKVKKGDIVATLDNSLYKTRVLQDDALIQAKKAEVKKLEKGFRLQDIKQAQEKFNQQKILMQNAKRTFLRYKGLLASKSVSINKYDDIKTQYKSILAAYQMAQSNLELLKSGYRQEDITAAKAQLKALQYQRDEAEINYKRTVLHAPCNGIVLVRVREAGSVVNPTQPVVELAKTNTYWVRAYMSERDLGLVKYGQTADILTDDGKTYHGRVSFISPIAQFTPKTVQTPQLRTQLVYRFRVLLNTNSQGVKQGMPVTLKFPNIQTK